MPRLILTDRDRETLHRLAAEWRSEPAPEDRGARTRETIVGLIGGDGEQFDRHAAYLLALSLVELLASAHLPPRAGLIVLRALESLADGEGGGEYVKIMNDLRGLPGAPTLPDSPFLSLAPGAGSFSAAGARAEPRPEGTGERGTHGLAPRAEDGGESGNRDPVPWSGGAGGRGIHGLAPRAEDGGESGNRDPTLSPAAVTERIPRETTAGDPSPAHRAARSSDADLAADPARGDAPAAWSAPLPETPESEAAQDIIPNLSGVDIEALARRAMRFAGNGVPDGARSRTPDGQGALTAESRSDGAVMRDGPRPTSDPTGDGARSRTPDGEGALIAESGSDDGVMRDGPRPTSDPTGDGARSRTPDGQDALIAESGSDGGVMRDDPRPTSDPTGSGGARSRTPFARKTHDDDARDRAPATPDLESVLFLESAGERFALRAGDVAEIVGAGADDAARTHGRPPVFVHRGESYRFVDLARALALEDTGSADESGPARVIVLLRDGGRRVALLCGGVDEREELPVHALPPMVPREALTTAAVVSGDDRPTLLLDTAALAEHAGG